MGLEVDGMVQIDSTTVRVLEHADPLHTRNKHKLKPKIGLIFEKTINMLFVSLLKLFELKLQIIRCSVAI